MQQTLTQRAAARECGIGVSLRRNRPNSDGPVGADGWRLVSILWGPQLRGQATVWLSPSVRVLPVLAYSRTPSVLAWCSTIVSGSGGEWRIPQHSCRYTLQALCRIGKTVGERFAPCVRAHSHDALRH